MYKFTLLLIPIILAGCQITPNKPSNTLAIPVNSTLQANADAAEPIDDKSNAKPINTPIRFAVYGKLAINAQTPLNAFYEWGQNGDTGKINLSMPFGVTAQLNFNTNNAVLQSPFGTTTAPNARTLFKNLTHIDAPIEALPYWIMGRAQGEAIFDAQGRIISDNVAGWQAHFDYADSSKDARVSRISIYQAKTRLTISINHAQ